MIRTIRRPNQLSPTTPGVEGFTIIELLIAGVLTALVVGGTATTLIIANRTSSRGGLQTKLETLIDQDLAAIRDLNDRFTCCPGSCTANAATIATAVASGSCSTSTAGNQNYYAPNQPLGTATTATQSFRTACIDATIATSLASEFPAVPAAPSGTTLTRSTVTQVDAAAHRLQWTYTATVNGSTAITRVVNLVPTVAAWCPCSSSSCPLVLS